MKLFDNLLDKMKLSSDDDEYEDDDMMDDDEVEEERVSRRMRKASTKEDTYDDDDEDYDDDDYDEDDDDDDKDKKTHMGEIGSRLVNKYPDFDVRNYGYSKLSTFLSEEFDDLDIDSGRQKFVSIKNHMDPKSAVKVKIIKLINESSETMYNMGKLNTDLKSVIPGFSIKKYGYSKFSSFLKSFGCFEVVGDKVTITN